MAIKFCKYLFTLPTAQPLFNLFQIFRKSSTLKKFVFLCLLFRCPIANFAPLGAASLFDTFSGIDVRDCGLWFMTRCWIFTTEFFVIMSLFTTRKKDKDHWNYQRICDILIIWKVSKHWKLNYVDCIPFSCIDSFHIIYNQAN